MAADSRNEDYPHEIDEQLTGFDSSVSSVKTMLDKLISMPRNELLQKVGWRRFSTAATVTRNIRITIKQAYTATPTNNSSHSTKYHWKLLSCFHPQLMPDGAGAFPISHWAKWAHHETSLRSVTGLKDVWIILKLALLLKNNILHDKH